DQRGVGVKNFCCRWCVAADHFVTTGDDTDAWARSHGKFGYSLGRGRCDQRGVDDGAFASQQRAGLHVTARFADETSDVHGREVYVVANVNEGGRFSLVYRDDRHDVVGNYCPGHNWYRCVMARAVNTGVVDHSWI